MMRRNKNTDALLMLEAMQSEPNAIAGTERFPFLHTYKRSHTFIKTNFLLKNWKIAIVIIRTMFSSCHVFSPTSAVVKWFILSLAPKSFWMSYYVNTARQLVKYDKLDQVRDKTQMCEVLYICFHKYSVFKKSAFHLQVQIFGLSCYESCWIIKLIIKQ